MATMVLSADVLYWGPRVLGLSAAAFLMPLSHSAFDGALDSQAEWEALLTHLLPSAVALLLVVVAWRRPGTGAWALPMLGLLHVAATWQRVPVVTGLMFAGLLVVSGVLFRADWHREHTSAAAR